MTQNYLDPKTYLTNLVAKKGKSGTRGVYLTNVTIVAEAEADYGYKVNFPSTRPSLPPENVDQGEWLKTLVDIRSDTLQDPYSLSFTDGIYQFLPEGNNLSMNVFLPSLEVDMFEYHVCLAQDILLCVSNFAGKVATTVRFNVGYANRTWEDLVGWGEAEERELSY